MGTTTFGFSVSEITVHAEHIVARRKVILHKPAVNIFDLPPMLGTIFIKMIDREKFEMGFSTASTDETAVSCENRDFLFVSAFFLLG